MRGAAVCRRSETAMTDTANTTSSTVSRLESIREALDTGTLRSIRRMMHSLHPAEIARLLESLRPAEREVVWELVDPEDDGEVLLHVNDEVRMGDRKSTRLNSSHVKISYAVFCLKKKKTNISPR